MRTGRSRLDEPRDPSAFWSRARKTKVAWEIAMRSKAPHLVLMAVLLVGSPVATLAQSSPFGFGGSTTGGGGGGSILGSGSVAGSSSGAAGSSSSSGTSGATAGFGGDGSSGSA